MPEHSTPSHFHGERVAALEARVQHNEQSIGDAWDSIAEIKDRLFNIALVVAGGCITGSAFLVWYTITAAPK
jgi:hypothetical protein